MLGPKYNYTLMKLAVGFITYNEQTSKYLSFFLPSLFQALSSVSGESRVWCIDNSEFQDIQRIEWCKCCQACKAM